MFNDFFLMTQAGAQNAGNGIKFDMNVVITLSTTITALVAAIFKGVNDLKKTEVEKEKIQKDMDNTLNSLFKNMEVIKDTAVENSEQLKLNRESNIAQQRYMLQKDLLNAILRGYTSLHEKVEITNLYNMYEELGGNGVIKKLFTEFNNLEVHKDD